MINNKKRIKQLPESKYQEIFGVKKATFDKMLEILDVAYLELHKLGGKPPKLSVLDKLVITLQYWREYRTYRHIAFDYGVSESNIFKTIRWIEDVLIQDGTFSLPGKKALLNKEHEYETAQIDATESPVERPKRGSESGIPARKRDTR